MIVQTPQHRSLYFQSGQLFPARRYLYGMSRAMHSLDFLVNKYIPQLDQKSKWEIPRGKVQTRTKNFWTAHKYGPILIAGKTDWEHDQVIDFYTESGRMATPGYGEDYSPMELWDGVSNTTDRMKKIFDSSVITPEQAREALYKEVQEARLAYVTSSKGLLLHLKSLVKSSNKFPKILDISAFGDRMVASAGAGLDYIGIDPDPSLVDGMSRLRVDLEKVSSSPAPKLYTLPLEAYWPKDLLDIITLSPPPFTMEKYAGGERQTHKVYASFEDWFNGFIRESLLRAYDWLVPDGVLAFTVLDRPADSASPGKPTITYTEAMILLTEDLGFEFVEIFGFPSKTPWWIFRKGTKKSNKLIEFYPELAPKNLYNINTPMLEYVRRCLQKYIIGVFRSLVEFKKHHEKMDAILGRFLMLKDYPNGVKTSDPIFFEAAKTSNFDGLEELSGVKFLSEKTVYIETSDAAYTIASSGTDGVSLAVSLYQSAERYIAWLVTTTGYQVASKNTTFVVDSVSTGYLKNTVVLTVEKRNALSTIGFLRRYVPFGPEGIEVKDLGGGSLILWRTIRPYDSKRFSQPTLHGLSDLRYDTVGAYGHHFTRPQTRIQQMSRIVGEDIVDLFATPFNTNTTKFSSLYSDVDSPAGSVGSFFSITNWASLGTTTFMANPPAFPGFITRVMDIIRDVLEKIDSTFFVGTVLWEDTDSRYLKKIRDGDDPEFKDSDNAILNYCWDKSKIRPEFLRAVYILNKQKYPSLNPMTGKTSIRDGSESVGVILSSKDKWNVGGDASVEELGEVIFFDPEE